MNKKKAIVTKEKLLVVVQVQFVLKIIMIYLCLFNVSSEFSYLPENCNESITISQLFNATKLI